MNKIITRLVIIITGVVLSGCIEIPDAPDTTAAQESGASEVLDSPTFADAQNIARLCYDLAVHDEDNFEELLSQGFTRETKRTLRRNRSVWEYMKGSRSFLARFFEVRKSAGPGGPGCSVKLIWLPFEEANFVYQYLQERLRNDGFVVNVRREGLFNNTYYEKGNKSIVLYTTDYNGGITFNFFDSNDEN